MKTLVFNASNISAYVFEDSDTVTVTATETTAPDIVIYDMNSGNATLHTNVTPPDDWLGGRYTFDGTIWTQVSGWTKKINERLAEEVRAERNKLLAETDHYGLSDQTMTSDMTTYRQALRDITDQSGFPESVTWPTKP